MQLDTGKTTQGLVGTFKSIVKEEGYVVTIVGHTTVSTNAIKERGVCTEVSARDEVHGSCMLNDLKRPCTSLVAGSTQACS